MVTHMSLVELMAEPHTIEDLQIPQNLVIDILLRLLYNEGNVNFRRMSQVTRVPSVLDEVLEWLRKEHLVEVSQASAGAGRLNYVYKLTEAGEERAQAAMERSQYVGPFPVPVHYYNRAIELQTQTSRKISPQKIQEALSDLVLPADFHRRIGPAVNSGASLFLYGPSGQWQDHHRPEDRRADHRHRSHLAALRPDRGRADHPNPRPAVPHPIPPGGQQDRQAGQRWALEPIPPPIGGGGRRAEDGSA